MFTTSRLCGPFALAALASLSLLTVSACDDSQLTEPDLDSRLAGLELSHSSVSLGESDSVRITVTPKDSTGAPITGAPVIWESADPSIATVDDAGLVRAVRAGGSTVVTAKVGSLSESLEITVLDQILFMCGQGICVVNEDGTGERPLLNDPGYINPIAVWSPDGEQVAVVAASGGMEYQVFVMNADGSAVKQLTGPEDGSANSTIAPAWSPDGSKLAIELSRDDSSHIYVVNSDGSGLTRLTYDGTLNSEPAWSPNGSKLAFVSNQTGKVDICVMDASGAAQSCHTESDLNYHPAWSPDGSRIAFSCHRNDSYDICVMNADGSGHTYLTDNAEHDMEPAWSPDGGQIAYMAAGAQGGFDIHVMNADGSGQTKLTSENDTYFPAWRPDGAKILYSSASDETGAKLKLVSASGGTTELVASGQLGPLSWRPRP